MSEQNQNTPPTASEQKAPEVTSAPVTAEQKAPEAQTAAPVSEAPKAAPAAPQAAKVDYFKIVTDSVKKNGPTILKTSLSGLASAAGYAAKALTSLSDKIKTEATVVKTEDQKPKDPTASN